MLTKDCPVGLRAVRRRLALMGSALAAMFLAAFTVGCGRTQGGGGNPVDPQAQGRIVVQPPTMGDVKDPPHPQGVVAPPAPLQGEVEAPATGGK